MSSKDSILLDAREPDAKLTVADAKIKEKDKGKHHRNDSEKAATEKFPKEHVVPRTVKSALSQMLSGESDRSSFSSTCSATMNQNSNKNSVDEGDDAQNIEDGQSAAQSLSIPSQNTGILTHGNSSTTHYSSRSGSNHGSDQSLLCPNPDNLDAAAMRKSSSLSRSNSRGGSIKTVSSHSLSVSDLQLSKDETNLSFDDFQNTEGGLQIDTNLKVNDSDTTGEDERKLLYEFPARSSSSSKDSMDSKGSRYASKSNKPSDTARMMLQSGSCDSFDSDNMVGEECDSNSNNQSLSDSFGSGSLDSDDIANAEQNDPTQAKSVLTCKDLVTVLLNTELIFGPKQITTDENNNSKQLTEKRSSFFRTGRNSLVGALVGLQHAIQSTTTGMLHHGPKGPNSEEIGDVVGDSVNKNNAVSILRQNITNSGVIISKKRKLLGVKGKQIARDESAMREEIEKKEQNRVSLTDRKSGNKLPVLKSVPSGFDPPEVDSQIEQNIRNTNGGIPTELHQDVQQLQQIEIDMLIKSRLCLFPAEEDGTAMDDLPEFKGSSDILDSGIDDFCLTDKRKKIPLLHVRISGREDQYTRKYDENVELFDFSELREDMLSRPPDLDSFVAVQETEDIRDNLKSSSSRSRLPTVGVTVDVLTYDVNDLAVNPSEALGFKDSPHLSSRSSNKSENADVIQMFRTETDEMLADKIKQSQALDNKKGLSSSSSDEALSHSGGANESFLTITYRTVSSEEWKSLIKIPIRNGVPYVLLKSNAVNKSSEDEMIDNPKNIAIQTINRDTALNSSTPLKRHSRTSEASKHEIASEYMTLDSLTGAGNKESRASAHDSAGGRIRHSSSQESPAAAATGHVSLQPHTSSARMAMYNSPLGTPNNNNPSAQRNAFQSKLTEDTKSNDSSTGSQISSNLSKELSTSTINTDDADDLNVIHAPKLKSRSNSLNVSAALASLPIVGGDSVASATGQRSSSRGSFSSDLNSALSVPVADLDTVLTESGSGFPTTMGPPMRLNDSGSGSPRSSLHKSGFTTSAPRFSPAPPISASPLSSTGKQIQSSNSINGSAHAATTLSAIALVPASRFAHRTSTASTASSVEDAEKFEEGFSRASNLSGVITVTRDFSSSEENSDASDAISSEGSESGESSGHGTDSEESEVDDTEGGEGTSLGVASSGRSAPIKIRIGTDENRSPTRRSPVPLPPQQLSGATRSESRQSQTSSKANSGGLSFFGRLFGFRRTSKTGRDSVTSIGTIHEVENEEEKDDSSHGKSHGASMSMSP